MTAPAEALETHASFEEATRWTRREPNLFHGHVDASWGQGRAVFGGIVGAGLARAMALGVPDDKTLRSLSVVFAGPVEPGALECATKTVREGKSATFVEAAITQGGTKRATATGIYGSARRSSVPVEGPARPDAPAPETVDSMPYIHGLTPRFTEWLETKVVTGTIPFMGSTMSKLGGWCRFRKDDHPGDVQGMLGLLDAWPCPAITRLRVPAPASSITWSVDFATPRTDHRIDEWWYWEADTSFFDDGYTSFDASLWAPDGRFVARSRQLVGVFER